MKLIHTKTGTEVTVGMAVQDDEADGATVISIVPPDTEDPDGSVFVQWDGTDEMGECDPSDFGCEFEPVLVVAG